MAGRRVQGSEKDGGERMEIQSKESRNLEAHCKEGQGPPPGCSAIREEEEEEEMDAASEMSYIFLFREGIKLNSSSVTIPNNGHTSLQPQNHHT
jgi:hypothetical protein